MYSVSKHYFHLFYSFKIRFSDFKNTGVSKRSVFARALTGTVQYSSLEKAVEQEDWKVSDNFTVGCWTSSPCLSVVTCETVIIRPLLPTL